MRAGDRISHPEHGDGAIEVMQTIKAALDPHNIMNPGKIVDC